MFGISTALLPNCDHAGECGPNTANEQNAPSSSTGPYLNPDTLEEIIRQALRMYPYMRPSLRAVSRFFRNIVDREPLLQVYIPELNDLNDIRRVSVRKIMRLKEKNSDAIIRLREIITIRPLLRGHPRERANWSLNKG